MPTALLPSELWEFDIEDVRREVDGLDHYDDLDRGGRRIVAAPPAGVASTPEVAGGVRATPGGDRLRILARSGGSTWGIARVARAADLPVFDAVETRFMSVVSAHVDDAIRASLVRTAVATSAAASGGAGTLILDAEHRAEGTAPSI